MLTEKQAEELKRLALADSVAAYEHGSTMFAAWNLDGGPQEKQAELLARCRSDAASRDFQIYVNGLTLKTLAAK